MASRAEHYQKAEGILADMKAALQDAEWCQVNALRALAHATLATAPWEMQGHPDA